MKHIGLHIQNTTPTRRLDPEPPRRMHWLTFVGINVVVWWAVFAAIGWWIN